jgi:hypothetical protein
MLDGDIEELLRLGPDTLDGLEAHIEAELKARQTSVFQPFLKWQKDPEGFIQERLLGFIWSKQREICRSVRDNRRTAVKSCHDVGKSYIASRIAAWFGSCNDVGEVFVVTLAPTFHQVKAILWRELKKAHDAGSLPGTMNLTEWKIGQELIAFGRSPADTDPTAIQGIHAPRVLVIGDEACGLSKEILDAADSLLANEDSRILLIGNPDDPSSEFATICKPGSGWNVIRINAFDSPNFTGEEVPDRLRPLLISKTWVQEKAKKWGVDSPLYVAKVLGEFPEQANDALIPIAAVNAATTRFLAAKEAGFPPTKGDRHDLGVDVARQGDDASVIYRAKGWRATCEHRHHKRDLMELVGEIIRCCRRDKPKRIKIDDTGMGGGVTDRLRQIQNSQDPRDNEARVAITGVEICPINVGESPRGQIADERFVNLRAELGWNMRVILTEQPVELEPSDDLESQIVQIKYTVPNGEIQIEKKADMKKRTKGKSPDDWDALVLAFAEPSFEGAGGYAWMLAQAAALNKPQGAGPDGFVAMVVPAAEMFQTIYGGDGRIYSSVGGQIRVIPDDVTSFLGRGYVRVPEQ